MGDKRKLQGEIERTLKKTIEGVEQFDDIFDKVQNAANANQKEKYEGELKKEIKKLQRLREQIKTWLASSEVKEKKPLQEARKKIEGQMEKFKIIERETKAKPFSKEALDLPLKVDPHQKEMEDLVDWFERSIERLNMQFDQFDAEIESFYMGNKKKKLDRDKQEIVDELSYRSEKHKMHIGSLEKVLRCLHNHSITFEQVRDIQPSIDDYIENCREPNFFENDEIYDELNLNVDDTPANFANVFPEDETPVTNNTNSNPEVTPTTFTAKPISKEDPFRKVELKESAEVFPSPRKLSTSRSSTSSTSTTCLQTPNNKTQIKPTSSVTKNSTSITPLIKPQSVSTCNQTINPVSTTRLSSSTSSRTASLSNSISHTSGYATVAGSGLLPTTHSHSPTQISFSSNTVISSSSCLSNSLPEKFSHQIPSTSILKQPMSLANSALIVANAHHPTTTGTNSVKSSQKSTSVSSPIPLHPTHPNTSASKSSTHHHHHYPNFPSENKLVPLGSIPSGSGSDSSHIMRPHSVSVPSTATPVTDISTQNVWNSLVHQKKTFASQVSSDSISIPEVARLADDGADALYYTPMTEVPPNFTSFVESASITTTAYSSCSAPLSSSQVSGQNHQQSYSSSTQNIFKLNRLHTEPSMQSSSVSTSSLETAATSQTSADSSPDSLRSIATKAMNKAGIDPPSSGKAEKHSQQKQQPHQKQKQQKDDKSSANEDTTTKVCNALTTAITTTNAIINTNVPTTAVTSAMVNDDNNNSTINTNISSNSNSSNKIKSNNNIQTTEQNAVKSDEIQSEAKSYSQTDLKSAGAEIKTESDSKAEKVLTPLLGVSPLGPVPVTTEMMVQANMLESCSRHIPQLADSERVRQYFSRNPISIAPYHQPQLPPFFNSLEFFHRLSPETLFFIFYYQEGTKAQYLAAKALKKQSWRFHTKYMTWFQRHEEPKTITDEYEMGTYIFFDYENWIQRRRESFVFEYKFLEDKDLS